MKNEGFVKVAKKSDIPLSHMKELQVNGQGVCVANIEENILLSTTFAVMRVDLLPTGNFKDMK